MDELLLLAASGLAREVLAAVRESGQFDVIGILDDDAGKTGTIVDGTRVLGPASDVLRYPGAGVVVCVGAGAGRARIVDRLAALGVADRRYATVIDSSVRIPAGCRIGRGSVLLGHVTLTAGVDLGEHVVAMPGVTLTHDDVVEDFATFAAGVSLGGGVRIGRGAYLGMNASVREGASVGANATIGMGAAVLTDVPAGETWAGVPARVLRAAIPSGTAA
ncbi:NeuD/PglB/VioB family sugar acetyltransferase [Arthrobacter sp. PM3]|uniref:NeuD/PglB/VioB family sugar acetyltransferase n=1 Tax=Arthrobacter sp. PM3 TaxID=2017685 RepID=UPI000E10BA7F|nr:NeuD/PglB/VioB family sugar acetyltransferase [Arthrobacter sp. PM3]AXJ09252.1 acetyltransferase [Arthrobacter sp. PM3]